MRNDNKQRVIAAIWENPEPAFGLRFTDGANRKESLTAGGEYNKKGRVSLVRHEASGGVTVWWNGNERTSREGRQHWGVIDYLMDFELHTGDFLEALKHLAKLYGIELEFSEAQRAEMARAEVIREISAVLVSDEAAKEAPEVVEYLKGRGFEPDGKHFGFYNKATRQRVKDVLKLKGLSDKQVNEYLEALDLKEWQAEKGYNLILPYYVNDVPKGFLFRSIWDNEKRGDLAKYRMGKDQKRAGYSGFLEPMTPAVVVEGELDALTLRKAGFKNVIAFGGGTLNEATADLLARKHISSVLYVPDVDFDEEGRQSMTKIRQTLQKFAEASADGGRIITSISIAELPVDVPILAGGKDNKMDVNKFAASNNFNFDALAAAIKEATLPAWKYQLMKMTAGAAASDISDTRKKVKEVIRQTVEAFEIEEMKQYADTVPELTAAGITSTSIGIEYAKVLAADQDKEAARKKEEERKAYEGRKADILQRMREAEERGAGPAEFATLAAELGSLSLIRDEGARKEWNKQLNRNASEALKMIAERPEGIKTKWQLGKEDKRTKEFKPFTRIEYTPANVEVFCAPTSHGKTMFLIQSALDFITGGKRPDKADGRTVLYISIEQTESQLLERALNVYIDIPTTAEGYIYNPRTKRQEECFKKDYRLEAIRAAIRGKEKCYGYDGRESGLPYDFKALSAKIMAQVDKYMADVFPRLKIVNTNASAETIAGNIQYFVNRFAEEGQEVGLILVDYIQLMTSDIPGRSSRTEELKAICKALHACAEAVDLPVVVAAQLNRDAIKEGIDSVSTANLGESADIERISHNLYFVWQVDRTDPEYYIEYKPGNEEKAGKWGYKRKGNNGNGAIIAGARAKRLFYSSEYTPKGSEEKRETISLKEGFMYVEQLKARDGRPGGWALFPFDGDSGRIDELTSEALKAIAATVTIEGSKTMTFAEAKAQEAEDMPAEVYEGKTEWQHKTEAFEAEAGSGGAGATDVDNRFSELLNK